MTNESVGAVYAGLLEQRRHELRESCTAIFRDTSSFLWEAGCGHGHFLTAYAQAHPEELCIGIDIASDRIARADKKRARAGLTNLHFIRADAGLFLEALPPEARITETFVLFPDPWPKSRHHKHRILQPRFLELLATRTAIDGRLYFRTDHHAYFIDAHRTVTRSSGWEIADSSWPFEFETVFQARSESHESFSARKREPSS